MARRGNVIAVIDVLGGCTVAACLCSFVWLTAVRNERTRGDLDALTQQLQRSLHDTVALQAARGKQQALLVGYKTDLATTGQLPAAAPTEDYFAKLSGFAERFRLRVVRVQPLSPRRYPGLLEQRYTYDVTGDTPDLIHFLQEIEETSFWADVSFLKIEAGKGPDSGGADPRAASLTISLFSALPVETAPDSTGT